MPGCVLIPGGLQWVGGEICSISETASLLLAKSSLCFTRRAGPAVSALMAPPRGCITAGEEGRVGTSPPPENTFWEKPNGKWRSGLSTAGLRTCSPTEPYWRRSLGLHCAAPRGLAGCLLSSLLCEKGKGPHSSRTSWKCARESVPRALPSPLASVHNWLWRMYGSV